MVSLPKEGRSQEIGRLAARALAPQLPIAWVEKEQDGDTDFGIDYLVQLKSDSNDLHHSFYLQLKGTTVPRYVDDKGFISHSFSVKTLNYYKQQDPLVMIAIVDLSGHEENLAVCPIYYMWLEDEWFEENKSRLDSNDSISIRVPTIQIINKKLDIFGYYSERFKSKFALNKLKKTIVNHSNDLETSLKDLTQLISDKPLILKCSEEQSDEPWITNPRGSISKSLKECADCIKANQINSALDIIKKLENRDKEFSKHEKAEFYYQNGVISSLKGNFETSTKSYLKASEIFENDRYKLGYIESLFKLVKLPDRDYLTKLSEELPADDYRNCIVKAKCLALINKSNDALNLMKENHPKRVVGQIMVLSIGGDGSALDEILDNSDEIDFSDDREKYIYYMMSSRRAFFKATKNLNTQNEIIPIHGKVGYDVELMKKALELSQETWKLANKMGYPSDIIVMLDTSPLIFSYFNKLDFLFEHFEQILVGRPEHAVLIRCYTKLLLNQGKNERVIELLERLGDELEPVDCSVLIFANYHSKQALKTLALLQKYESVLLANRDQATSLLFSVGAEIAEELFEKELSERYKSIVDSFQDGKALSAIRLFMRKSRENPSNRDVYCDELFQSYEKLKKPIAIAEQLFGYMNPFDEKSASKIILLGEHILKEMELSQADYLHMAQALLTLKKWKEAVAIANNNILKGEYRPEWNIVKAAALNNQGKIGEAFETLKIAINGDGIEQEKYSHYVNFCLKLGLLTEAEKIIKELLNLVSSKKDRIALIETLVNIYSSDVQYSNKLNPVIEKYGQLVDQDSCQEEGRYLMFFLTLFKCDEGDEEEKKKADSFRERLARYTQKFPNSPVLRQGELEINSGAGALIESMQKMVGVTDDQVKQWDKNKLLIRNGKLPVPFCMLEHFLSDTRDIYTSWMLSIHMPEEKLEYRLRHSPQSDDIAFKKAFVNNKKIVIEESSLLILNNLNILDKFLDGLTTFHLIQSVFDKLSQHSHPFVGGGNNKDPQQILKIINKHLSKLILLSEQGDNLLNKYIELFHQPDFILLTDDLYLHQMITVENPSVSTYNSFNVVEFLENNGQIKDNESFLLISNICEFGIYQPNMKIDLLCSTLSHFLNSNTVSDYSETEFKPIFDKVFDSRRDIPSAIELFFKMILIAETKYNCELESSQLLSLIRGLLLRHNYKSVTQFIAFWFVYCCIYKSQTIENEFVPISKEHTHLWAIYCDMMLLFNTKELSLDELFSPIVLELYNMPDSRLFVAYEKIKSAFIPLTAESVNFERSFQEMLAAKKLDNLELNIES